MQLYLQTRVDPFRDVIYVNGNRLPKKFPPKFYFALNKPKGLVFLSFVHALLVLFLGLSFILHWKQHKFFQLLVLMLSLWSRYICSSGDKESKSVLSLFDEYWKNWVWEAIEFLCNMFFLLKKSIFLTSLHLLCSPLCFIFAVTIITILFSSVSLTPYCWKYSSDDIPIDMLFFRVKQILEHQSHVYLLLVVLM